LPPVTGPYRLVRQGGLGVGCRFEAAARCGQRPLSRSPLSVPWLIVSSAGATRIRSARAAN